MELRAYQQEAIAAVERDWAAGERAVLVVQATGGGKTNVFCSLIARNIGDGRALVLVHRRELVEQARDRLCSLYPELEHMTGIVMAEQNDCAARIVFGTVQSLVSEARLGSVLEHGPFTICVCDECFVAGTKVDGRAIDTLRVGDFVTAWDESSRTFVKGKITRTMKRAAPAILVRLRVGGNYIVCTPNHPFLTMRGWVKANDLHIGDSMVQYTTEVITNEKQTVCGLRKENRGLSAHREASTYLLGMRQSVFTNGESMGNVDSKWEETRLLHSGMFEKGTLGKIVPDNGNHKSQVCQRAHETQEPDEQSHNTRENENVLACDGMETSGSRRKWNWSNYSGDDDVSCSRLGYRGSSSCWARTPQQGWIPLMLQDRCREHSAESRNRDRWRLPFWTQGAGREKASLSRISRVDNIEILKQASDGEFERVCPDGFVYNIEVERVHTYTVNGVVVHNCHHATAASYRAVLAAIDNPALRVVGVTATPVRADDTGLVEVFSKVSATHDIKTLLGLGYLVPPRWLAIQTGIDIGKPTNGDYTAPQLANVFETDNCLDLVVSSHQKFAAGRQAIAFLSSVQGAHRLADKFNATGIPAASADANTRKADRARILNGFKRGEMQVLCNMGLYTEGLDVPAASCIHQVRPTKSDGLYLQMVGRGLRPFPGKQDCLVLDYAPADSRQIVFLGDVLGAPRRDAVVAEVADEDGVLGGFTFDAAGFKWLRGKATELIARQLDYLNTSPWQWYRAPDGSMSLGLGLGSDENERTLFISADTPPRLWAIGKRRDEYNPRVVKLIAESEDFDALMTRADEISDRWGNTVLALKAKKWRREPASDAQLKFARRLGVSGANKGELAEKITHALAARASRFVVD